VAPILSLSDWPKQKQDVEKGVSKTRSEKAEHYKIRVENNSDRQRKSVDRTEEKMPSRRLCWEQEV
jgi:hypothetical protein